MAFVQAMAAELTGFEDLSDNGVKFEVSGTAQNPVLAISGGKMPAEALQKALSVVFTNFAMRCPGVGFIRTGEDSWRAVTPDDMGIPSEGAFALMPK